MVLSSMPMKTVGLIPAYSTKISRCLQVIHTKHKRNLNSCFLAGLHPQNGIELSLFCGKNPKNKQNFWISYFYLCWKLKKDRPITKAFMQSKYVSLFYRVHLPSTCLALPAWGTRVN